MKITEAYLRDALLRRKLTQVQIATELGVSRQRGHQKAAQFGLTRRALQEEKRQRKELERRIRKLRAAAKNSLNGARTEYSKLRYSTKVEMCSELLAYLENGEP